MATFFGILLIILAIAIVIFFIVGACVEEDITFLFIGLLFSLVPLVPGICLLVPDEEKKEKIEVVENSEVMKSNLITAEFLEAEGFYGSFGLYSLGDGLHYDIACQEIYTEVEKDFETQRLVIFDSISTIEQFQQFCNLKGTEKDFSKYLNSN